MIIRKTIIKSILWATGFLVVNIAQASLEWAVNRQVLTVHPAQASATAIFCFSNTGVQPVTITHVQTSCTCLSVPMEKRTWSPGEQGELKVVFDLRYRSGKLCKTVSVQTDDGNTIELHVECNTPQAYVVNNKSVHWRNGDTADKKRIRLVNPNAMPIKLLSLTSSHKALPAKLKTIREGFEYEVVITKKARAGKAHSVICIVVEPPPNRTDSKIIRVYAHAPKF